MGSSTRPSRWFPALAAGTLSAALTFALIHPGAPEAGADRAPPLAVSGPVELFGELRGDREGWGVHVRAVNGGTAARRCRVTATVTELRDSPMSRVMRMPRPLWTAELALAPEGRATAERRVTVPAAVARQLSASAEPVDSERRARVRPETITHRLLLEASCPSSEPVG